MPTALSVLAKRCTRVSAPPAMQPAPLVLPKFADAGAWTARIATGFETLVQSALKGKGAMAPQGGGDFNDTEIAGVAYMANAAGAKFAEPAAPAATGAAPGGHQSPLPPPPPRR